MFKHIALPVAVSLVCVALARGEDWHKNFKTGSQPELRVDAKDGSITVRAWDGAGISADVTATGWRIAPGELEVLDRQSAENVEITLRLPSTNWNLGNRAIRVEIRAPRHTRLNLRTGDGAIRVYDIEGEMRFVTGDGAIEAAGVRGSVHARTGDGSINVRGKIEALNLHTGDGSVEVSALAGSRLASAWRIETGDGSVTLRVPHDMAADLDLHTGDGSVRVDMPFQSTEQNGHGVKGKMNAGGPLLTVRTGDGSIRLGRI